MPEADRSQPKFCVSLSAIEDIPEAHIRHPLNPASDVFLKRLSPVAGLRRIGLYIARVPPGKESFAYHRHERTEEFILILSGRGRAEIGDDVFEVGPGDFMGFPAPDGPPHHLTNPFEQDLVYLMGGERSDFDIGYFPRLARRMIFSPTDILCVRDDQSERMTLGQWVAGATSEGSTDL